MFSGKISSGLFGFVILCFFLPWFNVSCMNERVMTLSGSQLAGITEIKEPSFDGRAKTKRKSEPLAVFVLLFAIAGLFAGFLGKTGHIASIASGCLGFAFVLILSSKLSDQAFKETGGALKVNHEAGYWLVLLTLFGTVFLNSVALITNRDIEKLERRPDVIKNKSSGMFCTECGSKNSPDSRFCENCGRQL